MNPIAFRQAPVESGRAGLGLSGDFFIFFSVIHDSCPEEGFTTLELRLRSWITTTTYLSSLMDFGRRKILTGHGKKLMDTLIVVAQGF